MKRTVYNDGVEVDASDLNNTEQTKSDEILLSRRTGSRFGVIEGLELVNVNNTITINPGKCEFSNGEVLQLTSPLQGITGASFDVGVSTFVGIRLSEITSNEKPHEVDPITLDTRADNKGTGELFVAADASENSRTAALDDAIDAELNDENYILLGEFKGTGVGLEPSPVRPTPLPITKGGDQPNFGLARSAEVRGAAQNIYSRPEADEFPIQSAEDHYHRSLIGTGQPSAINPHGNTLDDFGGEKELVDHRIDAHTNYIVGLEPPQDDFTPSTGTFAFSLVDPGSQVIVKPISAGDAVVVRGRKFTNGDLSVDTTLDFSGQSAGFYYIIARFKSTDNTLTITFQDKTTFDALCPLDDGKAVWLNNAVEDSEKPFFAIGMIRWNNPGFINLVSTTPFSITIPTSGDLIFSTAPPPGQTLLTGKKILDLRRFGATASQNIQKYSIRLDRLVEPITSSNTFNAHTDELASPGPDATTAKHITDFQADRLFGHKGSRGSTNHAGALASSETGNIPAGFPGAAVGGSTFAATTGELTKYGFQSEYDKWRQDNLTMTLMKWSDIRNLQTDDARAIGDAAAVSSGNPEANPGAGGYGTFRSGFLTNFAVGVRKRPSNDNRSLTVEFIVGAVSGGTSTTIITNPAISGNNGDPVLNIFRPSTLVIPIEATITTPWRIQCVRRTDQVNNAWQDLTVTAEFHMFY